MLCCFCYIEAHKRSGTIFVILRSETHTKKILLNFFNPFVKKCLKVEIPSHKIFHSIVNVKGLFDTFRDLHSKLWLSWSLWLKASFGTADCLLSVTSEKKLSLAEFRGELAWPQLQHHIKNYRSLILLERPNEQIFFLPCTFLFKTCLEFRIAIILWNPKT